MTAATARSRLKSSDGIALAAVAGLVLALSWRDSVLAWQEPLWVTAAFALGGWLLRGVNASGAIAGGMVAFLLYVSAGRRMFAVLFVVFVLTLGATLAGRRRKQALGVAEASSGRSAAQVTANLLVATAVMVWWPREIAMVVAMAALAEAAADTVSSEIGEAFGRKTYLVTTLRETAPGTNGGVSVVGTLAGTMAAACVAVAGLLMLVPKVAVVVGVAAVVGMLVDSVLGATLENKGHLNNDAVNLLGTATAAGVAWAVLCATGT